MSLLLYLEVAAGPASYTITAAVGTYALAGNPVNLLVGRRTQADVGTYTLAGQNTNLLYGRVLSSALGTYLLSGQDVTLTYLSVVDTFKPRGMLMAQHIRRRMHRR
jgi:hypothetical protein